MPGSLPDAVFIDNARDLPGLVHALGSHEQIAVDTESNGLHAYQEQVCLLQFSTPGADYLVDPLQISDLSPLGPVFNNPGIKKIFHAADYDMLCLRRDFGFEFANLFDTMHAARLLGRTQVGLGSILENEFGLHLDKRYQRADWGQRPLPSPQLAYAQLDTHYLIPLYNRLQSELLAVGRAELAAEDFQRMCQLFPLTDANNAEESNHQRCQVNGVHDLSPGEYTILLELCAYRDQVARRLNRPLFKVFSDNILIALAQAHPEHLEDLKNLPGMTHKVITWHGTSLIQAIQRGQRAEPVRPPRPSRPNEAYLHRLELLRIWRREAGLRLKVDSDVVLPKDIMRRIAENNPRHVEELAALLSDSPWRAANFGSEIIQVLTAHHSHSSRRK
jgi:ribonuclease D